MGEGELGWIFYLNLTTIWTPTNNPETTILLLTTLTPHNQIRTAILARVVDLITEVSKMTEVRVIIKKKIMGGEKIMIETTAAVMIIRSRTVTGGIVAGQVPPGTGSLVAMIPQGEALAAG